ncbi:MAG TPA: hypothetical protein VNX68_02600 [Nitrosopumilaceae archaeon]|jgi:hypothetical protein|nr:hypothetical protein [Nitrosopumilaceae archaeon]
MLDFKIELSTFGVRHFLVRPDDGKIIPTFINLPIELRRRLNSPLSDSKVVIEALRRNWVIVKLKRTTVEVAGISQLFKAEVLAERHTFGGKIRAYHRTVELLKYLEQYAGNNLPIRVRIFAITDKITEVDTHLSSSADFAKIFIHTLSTYTRPIERINPQPR